MTTDTEIIRAAVEYAEGWSRKGKCMMWPDGTAYYIDKAPRYILAALAAQLVAQIDAIPYHGVREDPTETEIIEIVQAPTPSFRDQPEQIAYSQGPDRTMNTLRACVEFYQERGDEAN